MNTIIEELKVLAEKLRNTDISDLFKNNPNRFNELLLQCNELSIDFSKQRIDQESIQRLIDLAEKRELSGWIQKLFSTEEINYTENRAAMHWALRLPKDNREFPELATEVHAQLEKMYALVEQIHNGQRRGSSGEVITDVVNIGVGGSDLGPLMVSYALSDFTVKTVKPLGVHFVSTMDGSQLSDLLHQLRPETTLFIVSSKSFSTIDTLSNAETVRLWLENALGKSEALLKNHFIGVSTNIPKMAEWGIAKENQLLLWDWVGGRYSLWSCIGLPIALTIGVQGFKDLLQGAHTIDEHFRSEEFSKNLPVMIALLGVWNTNFLDIQTHAVLPYDGRLKYFASYLQQLEMESNGKSIQRDESSVNFSTCPIIWGEVGPNAQHAFYQLLHQGTHAVSSDFIAPIQRYHGQHFTYVENGKSLVEQHHLALANCLAQSRLLAFGNQALEIDNVENVPKYKQYEGNQPSSTFLIQELNPKTLGMLIALYEHKVFVQSVIWSINPFDQWGVEKGKEIANQLLPILNHEEKDSSFLDGSTQGLLKLLLEKSNG